MAWAHTQSAASTAASGTGAATSVAVTLGATVSSGGMVVGAVLFDGGAPSFLTGVADDKGNVYTTIDSVNDPNIDRMISFYCLNITNAPQTITATFDASDIGRRIVVSEYSGIATTGALDGHNATFNGSGTSGADTLIAGSFTTSGNGDLIWAVGIANGLSAGTTPNAFTQRLVTTDGPGVNYDFLVEDFMQSNAGSINPTAGTSINGQWQAIMAAAFMATASNPTLVLGDYYLDGGLANVKALCDKIFVCSQMPTSYADATSTSALGNKNWGAGNAFSTETSYAGGMQISSIAITNGSITANGTAVAWAAVDSVNSRLLASGTMTGSQLVASGQNFTLSSFTIQQPH